MVLFRISEHSILQPTVDFIRPVSRHRGRLAYPKQLRLWNVWCYPKAVKFHQQHPQIQSVGKIESKCNARACRLHRERNPIIFQRWPHDTHGCKNLLSRHLGLPWFVLTLCYGCWGYRFDFGVLFVAYFYYLEYSWERLGIWMPSSNRVQSSTRNENFHVRAILCSFGLSHTWQFSGFHFGECCDRSILPVYGVSI